MKLKKTGKYSYYFNFMVFIVFSIFFAAGIFFVENGECGDTKNTFVMAVNRPETETYYKWIDLIYKEVFRRLDINFEAKYYPLKRASYEANAGRVDGEPARIISYGLSFPNLMRVEEPVFFMTVAAYTSDSSTPELNGWKSLENTGYRVEYPRGMKICEDNLPKVVNPEQLSEITETFQGLRKLTTGRIDIYIDDVNAATSILQNKKYGLKDKVHITGIMEEVPLYMYVHNKHKLLIPKLTDTIRAVRSEGLIEHYRKIAFGINSD